MNELEIGTYDIQGGEYSKVVIDVENNLAYKLFKSFNHPDLDETDNHLHEESKINSFRMEVFKMPTKKKVFVSFDFDNDRILKEFLIGQSKLPDSPFEVIDGSLKEAAPEKDWEDKARRKIRAADVVIVMVGLSTYRASGVLKEVKMANEEKIKTVQIIGRPNSNYQRVEGAGVLYSWSWDNLKKLLG